MEISLSDRPVRAADVPLDRLAGNTALSKEQKVNEVCRQFEAVLLRQVLQEAQKPAFGTSSQPGSVSKDIYQDLATNQMAEAISRSGALGLANSLQGQLTHQLGVREEDEEANDAPPLPTAHASRNLLEDHGRSLGRTSSADNRAATNPNPARSTLIDHGRYHDHGPAAKPPAP